MRWGAVIFLVLGIYLAYSLIDRFDPASMKGKRVVLTGASTGIGEQMAYHYAKLGAKLLITARRENRLKQVIAKCREVGDVNGEYYYLPADMSDMASTRQLIKTAQEKLGGIDYLVLNHILMSSLGEWTGSPKNLTLLQKILDVNFKAYVHLASHALPVLEISKGSIVVVSSVAGILPQPYVIAYSASKFALFGFFGGLREEMIIRKKDVSVTLCVIGLIGTDNAVGELRNFGVHFLLQTLPIAEPADAGLAIIKGGATREREIYFPYMQARPIVLLRDWIPEILAAFNRYLYSKE